MYTNLSICIVAENDEQTIRRCLQGITPLQCEIIFVDTGSADETLRIASEFTDQLYTIQDQKDLSAAYNFAAEKAGNDWILILRPDEFLAEADLDELKDTMSRHPDLVGMITRITPHKRHGDFQTQRERIGRLYNRNLFQCKGMTHGNIVPLDPAEEVRYFEVPLDFFCETASASAEETPSPSDQEKLESVSR